MSEFRVASRYARSLLNLAVETKVEDATKEDILNIANTCQQNRDLVLLLKNPIIKYDKKLVILKRLFENKKNPLINKFLELVARKNRANLLPDIAEVWLDFYNDYKKIIKAQVTSAVSLSESEKKHIVAYVTNRTGKKVELNESVDAELIGGFLLRIKDEQIDNSISGQLNSLKRKFTEKI